MKKKPNTIYIFYGANQHIYNSWRDKQGLELEVIFIDPFPTIADQWREGRLPVPNNRCIGIYRSDESLHGLSPYLYLARTVGMNSEVVTFSTDRNKETLEYLTDSNLSKLFPDTPEHQVNLRTTTGSTLPAPKQTAITIADHSAEVRKKLTDLELYCNKQGYRRSDPTLVTKIESICALQREGCF